MIWKAREGFSGERGWYLFGGVKLGCGRKRLKGGEFRMIFEDWGNLWFGRTWCRDYLGRWS